jgi:hypothetical protein
MNNNVYKLSDVAVHGVFSLEPGVRYVVFSTTAETVYYCPGIMVSHSAEHLDISFVRASIEEKREVDSAASLFDTWQAARAKKGAETIKLNIARSLGTVKIAPLTAGREAIYASDGTERKLLWKSPGGENR